MEDEENGHRVMVGGEDHSTYLLVNISPKVFNSNGNMIAMVILTTNYYNI